MRDGASASRASKRAAESKRRWIAEHAPGRSFADIGGLFIDGATSFEAEEAGASSVTLFDVGDREYAPGYLDEHARRDSKVRYVQGDLHDLAFAEQVGPHDVVWCTGVLYHTPNPVHQLMQLRRDHARAAVPRHPHDPRGTGRRAGLPVLPAPVGRVPRVHSAGRTTAPRPTSVIGTPFDERPMMGYANFWWGITPSALRAMLATARFEVVEELRPHPYPWLTEVVAKPVDADPLLPPTDYHRAAARRATGAPSRLRSRTTTSTSRGAGG